nr:NINE protein [uncultured Flavobacterium sp.]
MKSKITATVLTLFFGGIGIHKFYLGQSVQGILYLIFCWTFIPSILAFFQFFGLLLMSEHSFNIKYNNGF